MRLRKYLKRILEMGTVKGRESIVDKERYESLIKSIKEAEKDIKYLKYYDSLTGLPNRKLFKDKVDLAIKDAKVGNKTLYMMCFDVDRFKSINDTMGYSTGDLLLKKIAERVSSIVCKEDIIARVGEDEFAVISTNIINADGLASFTERFMELFNRPFNLMGNKVYINASLGVSAYPNHGQDSETLMRNANIAMHKAKEFKGNNNCKFFSEKMNDKVIRRLEIENDLRKAIENEELTLYYQPQVDIKKGTMVGSEALIRWNHPRKGLISPGEFIPIAEETGLITNIGEWVMRGALWQLKVWHGRGYNNHRMSINISTKQLELENFVERMDSIIREVDINPHFIDLEITETSVMGNIERTTKILKELKDRGFKISIDDFGTGFSSLGYLQKFPVDILKIDKTFIQNIPLCNEDVEIITAIINMAHALQLRVIAEGVETKEQLNVLKSKNCNEIQGYIFSRPVDVFEFEEIMMRKEPSLASHSY